MVTVPRNAAISETEKNSVGLWKEAIEQRTGVKNTPDREKSAFSTLLDRRMKELQCADINQYFEDSLDDAKGRSGMEWNH